MSVLVLGLSHKTAPVEVRERFAVPDDQTEPLVGELAQHGGISEALILSTCNRVEYMVRSESGDPHGCVLSFLGEKCTVPLSQLDPFLYRYRDREAVEHIFRVASSLDSMVVGEPQILGQIKDAYSIAKRAGAVRGPLDQLLTAAFRTARRVRNETGIGQMAVSISYVAVELARKIFGDLDGLSVLLVGAGKMSEAAARHLRGAGAKRVFVANRTYERAIEMARRFDGEPASFDRLHELLTKVDIVISSTGAPGFILSAEAARGIIAARKNQPIFLVDIAVPRDLDPAINQIDNIFLYDIDDLQQVADANLKKRRKEAAAAETIVAEEVEKWIRRLRANQVAPTIISLHEHLETMRQAEFDRYRAKLADLSPRQREAVEALTRGLMNKVAHPPITQMKRLADSSDGLHFVEFVKRAFNLKHK